MTPEKAQELREHATPGPWRAFMATSGQVIVDSGEYDQEGDVPLAAAAPDLAELVAGLRYEYAVEVQPVPGGAWHQVTQWTPDPSPVLPEGRALDPDERIVRRLAGETEVVS